MFILRKQTVIKADTLDQTLDKVLNQLNKSENLQSVVFYSHKLTELDLYYKIHNKKLLTIIKAFRQ